MGNNIQNLLKNIQSVILDKDDKIKQIFATWIMGGHVLLEDVPGTGKTVLSKCFAKSCDVKLGRVQFTPDLLPNDILGTTILDQESRKFSFRKGPIFSTFFLADEINRATPRTQSALLEAMAERQITIENMTTKLPETFFVMATQNPLESHGTFPLPEAQLDRFTIRISLGMMSPSSELNMVKSQLHHHPLSELKQVITENELIEIKEHVKNVKIDDEIIIYIIKLINLTRNHELVEHGASPRASIALSKLSQAYALLSGRDHVIPTDVYDLADAVLNHRIILTEDALFEGIQTRELIQNLLKQVPAPKIK